MVQPTILKEFKMLNTQLSKVYSDEAIKEAAQSRADRKAQNGSGTRKNLMQVVITAMLWIFQ
jgi:hypothetical protein